MGAPPDHEARPPRTTSLESRSRRPRLGRRIAAFGFGRGARSGGTEERQDARRDLFEGWGLPGKDPVLRRGLQRVHAGLLEGPVLTGRFLCGLLRSGGATALPAGSRGSREHAHPEAEGSPWNHRGETPGPWQARCGAPRRALTSWRTKSKRCRWPDRGAAVRCCQSQGNHCRRAGIEPGFEPLPAPGSGCSRAFPEFSRHNSEFSRRDGFALDCPHRHSVCVSGDGEAGARGKEIGNGRSIVGVTIRENLRDDDARRFDAEMGFLPAPLALPSALRRRPPAWSIRSVYQRLR